MAIAAPWIVQGIAWGGRAAWTAYRAYRAARTAQAVYNAVQNVEEQSKTESRAEPQACATCQDPNDPCKVLREEIIKFMRELNRRAHELNADEGNLPLEKPAEPHPRYGFRSIKGEQQQFRDKQRAIEKRLEKYREKNCGPPPDNAQEYVNLDTPSKSNPVTPPPLP